MTDNERHENTNSFEEKARLAIENDNVEALKRLLEESAPNDFHVDDPIVRYMIPGPRREHVHRHPLLHHAVHHRSTAVISFLWNERDASINQHCCLTPLFCALEPKWTSKGPSNEYFLRAEDVRTIRWLLENGADVNATVWNDYSVLRFLFLVSFSTEQSVVDEIVSSFLDFGLSVDYREREGGTALHYACTRCSAEIIRRMLDLGADVNSIDYENGCSPLHYACKCSAEIFRIMLSFGANVNLRDSEGNAPLHWAVRGKDNNPEVIQLLFDAGANVNARNGRRQTPLDLVLNVPIAQMLLKNGADLNLRETGGNTRSHYHRRNSLQRQPVIQYLQWVQDFRALRDRWMQRLCSLDRTIAPPADGDDNDNDDQARNLGHVEDEINSGPRTRQLSMLLSKSIHTLLHTNPPPVHQPDVEQQQRRQEQQQGQEQLHEEILPPIGVVVAFLCLRITVPKWIGREE